MNTLIVKLKSGESLEFENFESFSINEKNTLLTIVCNEKLCNYFSMNSVSYIIQSDSIPTETETIVSDGNGGYIKIKATEILCPICNGRGIVPENFYNTPGQNISFGDYIKSSSKNTTCKRCNGKGTICVPLPLN